MIRLGRKSNAEKGEQLKVMVESADEGARVHHWIEVVQFELPEGVHQSLLLATSLVLDDAVQEQ